LDFILEKLNRGPQWRNSAPLIQLMERLEACGGNLEKMMAGDPELAAAMQRVCTTVWIPRTNRTAYLVLQHVNEEIEVEKEKRTPGGPGMRPERYAALLFHVGTLNPEWDKLAGPCARCGRYYLKNRASQKVYCSRKCGNAATATVRTREQRQDSHADKLRRAQAAIQRWSTARTKDDWKVFVSKHEPEISPKFLTRAVNKGELKPPTKGR
jgi:hypothetical protein